MNPFLAIAACLNVGAGIWFFNIGSYKQAIIWLCYAVATAVLGTIKE